MTPPVTFEDVLVLLMTLLLTAAFIVCDRERTALSAKSAALDDMTSQRDYWRGKTEQLMDAALVRAGAIHQPTMESRKPLDRIGSVAAMVSGALNIQEIDSTKGRKSAQ